jgi:predicted PurR-regulated permease PerM
VAQISDDRFSNVLFYAVVLALGYFVVQVFLPFFAPLGWAVVLAVIFHSLNERLKTRWGPSTSALATTLGVTLILIVPVLLVTGLCVREGIVAARDIQVAVGQGQYGWFGRAWEWIGVHIAAEGMTADLPALIREGASRAGQYMAAELGAVVRNVVVFLFELFVTLFALFYFLRDSGSIMDRFRNALPFEPPIRDRMLAEARELIFASVTTSLVIAGVQGVLCGGAFAIVGLSSAVFWGVVMGFLSLLPLVGAWPVWIPAAIYLFSTGRPGRAVVLIAICGLVGGVADNILRPVLLGGRASLNGLLVFISVLGGIATFGVLGVVLGPIVVATVVGILDVYSGRDAAGAVPATDV